MSISRREMWFDFFPTTLIVSSSIPGPRDRGCWIGNLRGWEMMILTNWWSGLVENRCWHPTPSTWVHKPQEANGSFQPRDIFFPEEKESLSLPALLSEPVQGVLVHSSWAEVSKCKIHQKRATRLHTHEWHKVSYPRETQVKAREWGQSFSSFWSLMLFKGLTLPQRKHVVWWKASAWEAKRPRSW